MPCMAVTPLHGESIQAFTTALTQCLIIAVDPDLVELGFLLQGLP